MSARGDSPLPTLPGSVQEAMRRVVATIDRTLQHQAIGELARLALEQRLTIPTFTHLAQNPDQGPKLALEFLLRLPDELPAELIRQSTAMLADRDIPIMVRLLAAGKLLTVVPDEPRTVQPILASITTGLPATRVLERLIQLQSKVEVCTVLDKQVAELEGSVEFRCPKCQIKLTRSGLIIHLWHRHRLLYDKHQAVEPRLAIDHLVTEAAEAKDPEQYDAIFLQTATWFPEVTPLDIYQGLSARGTLDPDQTDDLLDRAWDKESGRCPVCLTAVPLPNAPLPSAGHLSGGRFAAEGFAIEVKDSLFGRGFTVEAPDAPEEWSADVRRFSPRVWGVWAGLGVMLLAAIAVILIPQRTPAPWVVGGWLILAAWLVYWAVTLSLRPLADTTERALDLAWREFVPGIGRSEGAVLFLTRLSRASLNTGSPLERATLLYELVEHAAVLADKGGIYIPFLATVQILQALDSARLGREKIHTLAGLFETGFRGELPLTHPEGLAELILTEDVLTEGERVRLGVSLLVSAFENGISPVDLVTIARFVPYLKRLLLDASPLHVSLLGVLWRGRASKPWTNTGTAWSILDIVASDPTLARQILLSHPDALLVLDFDNAPELGMVVITARGLAIGGAIVADPDAIVEIYRNSGRYTLRFGSHSIPLEDQISDRMLEQLRRWLRYYAQKLVTAAEKSLQAGPTSKTEMLLRPMMVPCPLCGLECLHRLGQFGTPWQAIVPRS